MGSKESFLGGIDQETGSMRFLVFDRSGNPVVSHQVEFQQIYPNSGRHEHDPLELVLSAQKCIDEALKTFRDDLGYRADQIKSVGITNQRETIVVWNWDTGETLHNAIVWTDMRTQQLVHELKECDGAGALQEVCGEPLSTYPSAAKLLWIMRNSPRIQDAYQEGRLAFGTVDPWLVYKLNGGTSTKVFVTDATNASRTMFMKIRTLQYDPTLLSFFQLAPTKLHLPEIVRSSDRRVFGKLNSGPLEALVGQLGFEDGNAANTYGMGYFLLCNVEEDIVFSKHGLLSTVAHHFGEKPTYAVEGSIAVAGSARTVDDSDGCSFVTAFRGLFAPYWIDSARGMIFGITADTQNGHIARATLEATCSQTKAILDAMEADSGKPLSELAVDGGMSSSDLCMQMQADAIGITVRRPRMRETTALAAAIAAGLASGVWRGLAEVQHTVKGEQEWFGPLSTAQDRSARFATWSKAVQMCKGWTDS